MIEDLDSYSKEYLKILTKDATLDPLTFNTYQAELSTLVRRLKTERKPIRIIVLKARQLGISTWGTAYTFHECATNAYMKSTVIANDVENTNNLFNMHKRYYDFCPPEVQPMKRYSNDKSLVFENHDDKTRYDNPGLLSSINLETAGKKTAGRSGTMQILHASEFAFWENAGVVKSGLFQSVPLKPNTTILIESTANGMEGGDGEEFYNMWKNAEQKYSDYIPIFFPWWKNPDYQMEATEGFELTEEEKFYQEMIPQITNAKLTWRRYKIANEMGSALLDPNLQFKQEYPAFPDEAFISTGRRVFSGQEILESIERAKHIRYIQGYFHSDGKFSRDDKGPVKMFHIPRPGKIYALGADIAEGLETGDYSTYNILDKDYRQVCTYHGHIAPDLFGKYLCIAGTKYNRALLAPEINNHGHATLAKIRDMEYGNIFTRLKREERTENLTKKLGWQTNTKTKMKMLDDFVAAYRDKLIKINDIDLLKEMLTLTVEPDGNVNLNGKDRVVAMCISLQAIKQAQGEDFEAIQPAIKPRFKNMEEKMEWLASLGNTEVKESYFE